MVEKISSHNADDVLKSEVNNFPRIGDLSPAQKEELVKQLYLYDAKMRDDDRRMIVMNHQQNYNLFFKVTVTVSTLAIGGSAVVQLSQRADPRFLLIAWSCFICSLTLIASELVFSIIQSGCYADKLAKNEEVCPKPPNNNIVYIMIVLTVISLIAGMIFLLISLACGQ